MIEKTVLDFLDREVNVPVRMETPENPPAEYVLIEKIGSDRENWINRATFAIQSIAPSMLKAASLNEVVKSAMDRLVSEKDVFRSELNSDYNFTDTTTKQYRYQAVYDVYY